MSFTNRRRFLSQSLSLGGLAGAAIINQGNVVAARSAVPNAKVLGANDRIRVGLIGCGGMGRADLRDFLRVRNVECVALCDVDDRQSAIALKEVVEPLSANSILVTRDFCTSLGLKELDAVIIATPDHWHAQATVMGCQAGKDVYVEKPLSVAITEGRTMVAAARKHGRVVQMGTQQRSAPHYSEAVEFVRSGKLGKLRLVRAWAYLDGKGELPRVSDSTPPPDVDYDLWLGPAPKRPFNENRFHLNFRWFWDYSGGLMTDWGAHMIDIANWAMGSQGTKDRGFSGRQVRIPRRCNGNPGHPTSALDFPGFQYDLGTCTGDRTRSRGSRPRSSVSWQQRSLGD